MSTAETNGNIYLIGSILAAIGAWFVWSFGVALFGLGVSWMSAGIVAAFFGTKSD